ncbi:MAG TPA: helix-turn-helix domain-containing protein [Bacteroidota bacterium]|nr:helix-turn-helix domain-containing protein [Bacteroidota bacterium]
MVPIYIKNMVCPRCIRVVREELTRIGLDVRSVVLGEAEVEGAISPSQRKAIKNVLEKNGFELIRDRHAATIEKIKHAVIRRVQIDERTTPVRVKDSVYIEREVGERYAALSALFSSVENITIEHYLILQRIERVKELLKYGDTTLTEIAYILGYSSVAHLSGQFRKVTGMTPSAFLRQTAVPRRPIDTVGRS